MGRTMLAVLSLLLFSQASGRAIASSDRVTGTREAQGSSEEATPAVSAAVCYAGPVPRGASRAVRRQRAAAVLNSNESYIALRWSQSRRPAKLPYFKDSPLEPLSATAQLGRQTVQRLTPDTAAASGTVQEASNQDSQSAAAGGIADSSNIADSAPQPQVAAASICSADPRFSQTANSRTTCRLKVNTVDGYVALCTAWFVTKQHVVTAGHCSASFKRYIVDTQDPGVLCCGYDRQGNCYKSHAWRLLSWVTTYGWWNQQLSQYDGSVFKVEPWYTNKTIGGAPQRIQSFYPNPIPRHVTYMDGFPGQVPDDRGCGVVDPTKRYYTQSQVAPVTVDNSATNGTNGMPVSYFLAGCMGESGGRVLLGGPNGPAYGIQTFGSTVCRYNRGSSGVTQIVPACAPDMRAGVCVSCLVAALP